MTLESQAWLSERERAAIAEPVIYVPASHRKLFSDPAAQRHILRILAEENRGGPP